MDPVIRSEEAAVKTEPRSALSIRRSVSLNGRSASAPLRTAVSAPTGRMAISAPMTIQRIVLVVFMWRQWE